MVRSARSVRRVPLGALAELLELPVDGVLEGLLVRPRLPAELLPRLVVAVGEPLASGAHLVGGGRHGRQPISSIASTPATASRPWIRTGGGGTPAIRLRSANSRCWVKFLPVSR